MKNLCQGCSAKTPSHISGTCMGRANGTLCGAPTLSYDFKLCDPCSTLLGQCSWCQSPLNSTTTSTSLTKSGVMFAFANDNDNGRSFTLKVGQQLHVELNEDSWSGVEWSIDRCDAGLSAQSSVGVFTPSANNYRYGVRLFIIDVTHNAAGRTGNVRLHEVTRRYYSYYYGSSGGQPAPNGKKWSCSVVVR